MADGDAKMNDYVTFREIVAREEELRRELRAGWKADDETVKTEFRGQFTHFGTEVGKQFVEEREKLREIAESPKKAPAPDPTSQPQNFRAEITEMASGKHGAPLRLVGIGLIVFGLGILSHAPWIRSFI